MSEDTKLYRATLRDEEERLTAQLTAKSHERLRLAQAAQLSLDALAQADGLPLEELAHLDEALSRASASYIALEQRYQHLANLRTVFSRLLEARDRAEALTALNEILINIIGSEHFAIFTQTPDGLSLLDATGLDPEECARVCREDGPLKQTAESGALYIKEPTSPQEPLACVPLFLDWQLVGMIAIFELLPQKATFGLCDHELLAGLSLVTPLALFGEHS